MAKKLHRKPKDTDELSNKDLPPIIDRVQIVAALLDYHVEQRSLTSAILLPFKEDLEKVFREDESESGTVRGFRRHGSSSGSSASDSDSDSVYTNDEAGGPHSDAMEVSDAGIASVYDGVTAIDSVTSEGGSLPLHQGVTLTDVPASVHPGVTLADGPASPDEGATLGALLHEGVTLTDGPANAIPLSPAKSSTDHPDRPPQRKLTNLKKLKMLSTDERDEILQDCGDAIASPYLLDVPLGSAPAPQPVLHSPGSVLANERVFKNPLVASQLEEMSPALTEFLAAPGDVLETEVISESALLSRVSLSSGGDLISELNFDVQGSGAGSGSDARSASLPTPTFSTAPSTSAGRSVPMTAFTSKFDPVVMEQIERAKLESRPQFADPDAGQPPREAEMPKPIAYARWRPAKRRLSGPDDRVYFDANKRCLDPTKTEEEMSLLFFGEDVDPSPVEHFRPAGALYGRSLMDALQERSKKNKAQQRHYVAGQDGRRSMMDWKDSPAAQNALAGENDEDVPIGRYRKSIFGPDMIYQRDLQRLREEAALQEEERSDTETEVPYDKALPKTPLLTPVEPPSPTEDIDESIPLSQLRPAPQQPAIKIPMDLSVSSGLHVDFPSPERSPGNSSDGLAPIVRRSGLNWDMDEPEGGVNETEGGIRQVLSTRSVGDSSSDVSSDSSDIPLGARFASPDLDVDDIPLGVSKHSDGKVLIKNGLPMPFAPAAIPTIGPAMTHATTPEEVLPKIAEPGSLSQIATSASLPKIATPEEEVANMDIISDNSSDDLPLGLKATEEFYAQIPMPPAPPPPPVMMPLPPPYIHDDEQSTLSLAQAPQPVLTDPAQQHKIEAWRQSVALE